MPCAPLTTALAVAFDCTVDNAGRGWSGIVTFADAVAASVHSAATIGPCRMRVFSMTSSLEWSRRKPLGSVRLRRERRARAGNVNLAVVRLPAGVPVAPAQLNSERRAKRKRRHAETTPFACDRDARRARRGGPLEPHGEEAVGGQGIVPVVVAGAGLLPAARAGADAAGRGRGVEPDGWLVPGRVEAEPVVGFVERVSEVRLRRGSAALPVPDHPVPPVIREIRDRERGASRHRRLAPARGLLDAAGEGIAGAGGPAVPVPPRKSPYERQILTGKHGGSAGAGCGTFWKHTFPPGAAIESGLMKSGCGAPGRSANARVAMSAEFPSGKGSSGLCGKANAPVCVPFTSKNASSVQPAQWF